MTTKTVIDMPSPTGDRIFTYSNGVTKPASVVLYRSKLHHCVSLSIYPDGEDSFTFRLSEQAFRALADQVRYLTDGTALTLADELGEETL